MKMKTKTKIIKVRDLPKYTTETTVEEINKDLVRILGSGERVGFVGWDPYFHVFKVGDFICVIDEYKSHRSRDYGTSRYSVEIKETKNELLVAFYDLDFEELAQKIKNCIYILSENIQYLKALRTLLGTETRAKKKVDQHRDNFKEVLKAQINLMAPVASGNQ